MATAKALAKSNIQKNQPVRQYLNNYQKLIFRNTFADRFFFLIDDKINVYNVNMNLSIKSTRSRNDLRAELVELEERINEKIKKITWTNQKLPYDRLAKGRQLKETVLLAVDFLDRGENAKLNLVLDRIESLGVKLENR